MAYNHGREDRKWRIWKEAEEKLLRECGVKFVVAAALLFGAFDQRAQPVSGFEQPVLLCRQGAAVHAGGQFCGQFCGQQGCHGTHALGLQRLVGVPQRRGVVLDRRGHIPGNDLRCVVVQRRHRHGAGVQAAAELLVADHRQSVGQDGHLMTVLLDVLRRGVAHQGPPLDEPHPGDVGKEMALHVSPPKAHPAGMLRQCR